ncbi:MAG TPA: 30S ribosomal protein S16 [Actinomycetes bacterium]|nr:30S ribosomal protein S16 [Actinomycetes bacterium]
MAVKIKLKRIGKMREPHYRIVVADARTKRGGRAIEEIGQYHPLENPSRIQIESDRVQYWLGVGAQPTDAVAAILRVTGDWQAFNGEPAPAPMQVAEPKADKKAVFEAAAKEAAGIEEKPATTPKAKKKTAKAEPKTEEPKADEAKAAEPKAEEPKAEEPKAEAEAPDAASAESAESAESAGSAESSEPAASE